jgi:hypothetical protein
MVAPFIRDFRFLGAMAFQERTHGGGEGMRVFYTVVEVNDAEYALAHVGCLL